MASSASPDLAFKKMTTAGAQIRMNPKCKGRVPLIVHGGPTGSTKGLKLMVPKSFTPGSLLSTLQEKIPGLDITKMALSVNGTNLVLTAAAVMTMQEIDEEYKFADDFLYIDIMYRDHHHSKPEVHDEGPSSFDVPASSGPGCSQQQVRTTAASASASGAFLGDVDSAWQPPHADENSLLLQHQLAQAREEVIAKDKQNQQLQETADVLRELITSLEVQLEAKRCDQDEHTMATEVALREAVEDLQRHHAEQVKALRAELQVTRSECEQLQQREQSATAKIACLWEQIHANEGEEKAFEDLKKEVHDEAEGRCSELQHKLDTISDAVVEKTMLTQALEAHNLQLDAKRRELEMELRAKSIECDTHKEEVGSLQRKNQELEEKLRQVPLLLASKERLTRKVQQLEASLKVSEGEREWHRAGLEEALKKIESLKSEGQKGDQVRLRARAAEARCTELERQLQEFEELSKEMLSSATLRSDSPECHTSTAAESSEATQVSDDAVEEDAVVRADEQEEQEGAASVREASHSCDMTKQEEGRDTDRLSGSPITLREEEQLKSVARSAQQVQDSTHLELAEQKPLEALPQSEVLNACEEHDTVTAEESQALATSDTVPIAEARSAEQVQQSTQREQEHVQPVDAQPDTPFQPLVEADMDSREDVGEWLLVDLHGGCDQGTGSSVQGS